MQLQGHSSESCQEPGAWGGEGPGVRVPTQPLVSCMILGEHLNLRSFSFQPWKTEILTAPTWRAVVRAKDRDVPAQHGEDRCRGSAQ